MTERSPEHKALWQGLIAVLRRIAADTTKKAA